LVTSDGMVFSVTEYLHPKDRVFGMLRFVRFPVSTGFQFSVSSFRRLETEDRPRRGSPLGGELKKLGTTEDSYEYLKKHHPEYLFQIDVDGTLLQAVPESKIVKVIKPEQFLRKLKPDDSFKKKILDLAGILSKKSGVPLKKFGVSGSVLVNAHGKDSDIDMVVYGLRNFSKVRACMPALVASGVIQKLGTTQWKKLYEKRLPHKELSFREFVRHAKRKNNVGFFNGTRFDLLCTRDWSEIFGKYGDVKFEKLGTTYTFNKGPPCGDTPNGGVASNGGFAPRFTRGSSSLKKSTKVCIQAKVTDDFLAFDYPARFKVKSASGVTEIVSYTHTYAGQARKGETVEAQGVLEKVISKKGSRLRLLIGSTREAKGEYIKVLQ